MWQSMEQVDIGQVTGYTIGAKTGTSEPPEDKTEQGYVASYVAISPIEDTQVAILLTLYKPTQGDHNGGTLAGPVVSQMLSEILPYLNVPSTESTTTTTSADNSITVPDVRNKTITEANKILKEAGFTTKITTSGDQDVELVSNQVPKPGVSLQKNAIVVLYSKEAVESSTTVPDLKGMTLSQATSALKEKNLNISYEGSGTVLTQDYSKDTQVPEGTVISVTLKQTITDTH